MSLVFFFPLLLHISQPALCPWFNVWRKWDQHRMLCHNTTSLPHRRQRQLDACSSSPIKKVMHSAVSSSSPSALCWIKADCSPLITRIADGILVTMFDLHIQIGMTESKQAEAVEAYCERELWKKQKIDKRIFKNGCKSSRIITPTAGKGSLLECLDSSDEPVAPRWVAPAWMGGWWRDTRQPLRCVFCTDWRNKVC